MDCIPGLSTSPDFEIVVPARVWRRQGASSGHWLAVNGHRSVFVGERIAPPAIRRAVAGDKAEGTRGVEGDRTTDRRGTSASWGGASAINACHAARAHHTARTHRTAR